MEYLASFRNRKVDSKGRFPLPPEWIEDSEFFFEIQSTENPGEGWLHLYTKKQWKKLFDTEKIPSIKMSFSRRSTFVKIDKQNRLILPKEYTKRKIDLVGMGDHIVIIESALWAGFF